MLNFLGHHVELVNGGDVPLTLGLWRLMHRVVGGGSNRRDGWPTTGLKPVARREKWLVSIAGNEPVKRPIYEHQTRMLALKMSLVGLFCFRLMSIQTCFTQDSLFCADSLFK
jgi:hypothetical protein